MSNPLQLTIVNFNKGSYIIVEGKQNANYFYILRSGKVRISKEVELLDEERGQVLNPGDFFGVVSTMSAHSHIETAVATSDVSLISVHRDQYGLLIEKNTPVAMKIIQGFSKKMRVLDVAVTRLMLKSTALEDSSHLFHVAEYYARQSKYNQAYYAYYQYIKHCPTGENIAVAKERLTKIQPYAKYTTIERKPDDFNQTYPKDTMIFSEAEPGRELYIIQKGSVKITKIVNDQEILLAVLKPGDIFGEMALLEDKPRSASAIAFEDCVLLAVNKANFERMVTSQPQIIARLTTLLAERIWFSYKQLANTLMQDPVGRMFDALLIQLEKSRVNIDAGSPYTFEFGPRELINLVGLPMNEGNVLLQKVFDNKKIRLIDNRIHVTDVTEIDKQVQYFRKMEQIEKSRREGSRKY